jgi:hypothetical protein
VGGERGPRSSYGFSAICPQPQPEAGAGPESGSEPGAALVRATLHQFDDRWEFMYESPWIRFAAWDLRVFHQSAIVKPGGAPLLLTSASDLDIEGIGVGQYLAAAPSPKLLREYFYLGTSPHGWGLDLNLGKHREGNCSAGSWLPHPVDRLGPRRWWPRPKQTF